jgi:phage terminase large subunit
MTPEEAQRIFAERARRLQTLRANPEALAYFAQHYRQTPWDFVNDWGVTIDPRSIAKGRWALVPFHLWPKQVELSRLS